MLAGMRRPLRGKAELAMLGWCGAVSGYSFGFLLKRSAAQGRCSPGLVR
jgi:hypothetical protein